jgi:hypothetical protein
MVSQNWLGRLSVKPIGMALRSFRQGIAVVAAALWIAADSLAMAQSRAADLRRAKVEYVLKSSVFSAKARERAIHFIETVSPRAEAMTREQFLLCLFRIAAFADNGHDSLHDAGGAWWPEGRLPIRMIWFPGGWVIARTDSANADILGARVESIEGLASSAMFRYLRDLAGGTDPYRLWNLEPIIEKAGLLHAAGLARYPDRVILRVRLKNGANAERTLFFVPNVELPAGQWFERIWSPAPWPGEAEKGWRAVDPQPTPLYLQEGERLFRVVPLPELNALYLQMRVHFDADGQTVADFRRAADQAIEAGRPRNLIVDLRFDTGGDIDQTRNWQHELVGRVPGLVYVLVAPYTFSAGIVSAAAFKHDARERARIVGEGVGDRLRWWSEGKDVCLPTSRYCFHLTTGQWDLVHGCAGQPDCYGDKYDARVNDLQPNLFAPLTQESWLAGADPGMEAIERDIASRVQLHPG